VWLATVEAFVEAEHNPQVRELLAAAPREGRRGLAASLLGVPEETVDETTERRIGAVQNALFAGICVQWLLDPEHAPSTEDVMAGLRALTRHVADGGPGSGSA
jgi:hypothetical protein